VNKALFVSDIHISSVDDPKYILFLQFLDRCLSDTGLSALFLVGDIFDLWIADQRWFIERYAEAVARVRALVDRGVSVHYFEGNHDLDLRVFWADVVGVHVHEGAFVGVVGGWPVRVEHGDQMDPEDRGYLFLRWLLRTGLVRWLGRVLPGWLVRRIGERSSLASRRYTSSAGKSVSDEVAREKIRRHVRGLAGAGVGSDAGAGGVLPASGFDVFVSGHVHVVMDESVPVGAVGSAQRSVRCFNLGTWLKEPMVLEIAEGKLALVPLRG
jgi:UDP-2,3-diacylglucosamine hydrolase